MAQRSCRVPHSVHRRIVAPTSTRAPLHSYAPSRTPRTPALLHSYTSTRTPLFPCIPHPVQVSLSTFLSYVTPPAWHTYQSCQSCPRLDLLARLEIGSRDTRHTTYLSTSLSTKTPQVRAASREPESAEAEACSRNVASFRRAWYLAVICASYIAFCCFSSLLSVRDPACC